MDKKRILLLSALVLLFTSPVAAQVGSDINGAWDLLSESADLGITLLEGVMGTSLGEQNAIQVFSTIGLLYVMLHFSLDKIFETAGIRDMFVVDKGVNEGESKIRLILTSLLMYGVFLGSQALTPVIIFVSTSLVALILLMIAAAITYGVYAAGGVGRFAYFGGRGFTRSASASGREKFSEGSDKLSEWTQKARESDNLLERVRNEEADAEDRMENGDSEVADQEIQDALSNLKNVGDSLEDIFEEDYRSLEHDINDIKNAFNTGNEFKGFEKIEARAERAVEGLVHLSNKLENFNSSAMAPVPLDSGTPGEINVNDLNDFVQGEGPFSGGPDGNYGLRQVSRDLKKIDADLDRIKNWESIEDNTLRDALDDVLDDAKALVMAHQELNKLVKLVKEAEYDVEALESIAENARNEKLMRDARGEEEELDYLEDQIRHLEQEQESVKDDLKELKGILDRILNVYEVQDRELVRIVEDDDEIGSGVAGVKNELENNYDPGSQATGAVNVIENDIEPFVADIKNKTSDAINMASGAGGLREFEEKLENLIEQLEN